MKSLHFCLLKSPFLLQLWMLPGTRLGPYEIIAGLGAGGMGEVYHAHDSKLNRDVAIKVLLPAVANDSDRLARFSREAQVLAQPSEHRAHPRHQRVQRRHGLVMEDYWGESLSVRGCGGGRLSLHIRRHPRQRQCGGPANDTAPSDAGPGSSSIHAISGRGSGRGPRIILGKTARAGVTSAPPSGRRHGNLRKDMDTEW